jgi:hypothetical protein
MELEKEVHQLTDAGKMTGQEQYHAIAFIYGAD